MDYETIELELKDKVAVIRLNRPDVKNALNTLMRAEITQCVNQMIKLDKKLQRLRQTANQARHVWNALAKKLRLFQWQHYHEYSLQLYPKQIHIHPNLPT